ncbi:MAG: pseudouridine synthase [Candidatus Paceibacterota bacterium]
MDFPIRINKYLANEGMCSRKEADRLIARGAVLINGKRAELGQKVEKGDEVSLKREAKKGFEKERAYLLFFKPKGIVTVNAQGSDKEIRDIVSLEKGVVPIGRLDKLSTGLVLLSNDGRITKKLLSPEFNHAKEYKVKVNKILRPGFLMHLEEGVTLEDGYKTKPAKVKKLGPKAFSISITEGKHHQIRRMCAIFGYEVEDLSRTAILGFRATDMKSGELKKLTKPEVAELLKALGISNAK